MTRTEEFLIELDEGMLQYFRDIADELVGRFGMSRAEAVARINAAYEGADIEPYPDLMCHEEPDHWAYGLYFLPKSGRSPHGASVGDLTGWETRPAPPKGSHVWTLAECTPRSQGPWIRAVPDPAGGIAETGALRAKRELARRGANDRDVHSGSRRGILMHVTMET